MKLKVHMYVKFSFGIFSARREIDAITRSVKIFLFKNINKYKNSCLHFALSSR